MEQIKTQLIDERFTYTDDIHASYEDNGYHIFEHFLTGEGLQAGLKEIDRMLGQRQSDIAPDNMICTHHQEPWIFDLASQAPLLDMLEHQIGPNITLWSSHMLCKSPGTGEMVPWHQDAPYWNVTGTFGAGIWIAFDDIDQENGGMSVIPEWHRKGTLPIQVSKKLKTFNQEIQPSHLPPDLDDIRVDYVMKAGQLAIHNVMIPHNSRPNVSDRWRRVLVLRYIAADAEIGPKEYTNYKTGEPFPREAFLVRGEDVRGLGLRRTPFAA